MTYMNRGRTREVGELSQHETVEISTSSRASFGWVVEGIWRNQALSVFDNGQTPLMGDRLPGVPFRGVSLLDADRSRTPVDQFPIQRRSISAHNLHLYRQFVCVSTTIWSET